MDSVAIDQCYYAFMYSVHSQRGWVVHIAMGGRPKANSIILLVIVQRHQPESAMQDPVSGLVPDTFCSPGVVRNGRLPYEIPEFGCDVDEITMSDLSSG